jgi:phosphate transport system substrate-binding protein
MTRTTLIGLAVFAALTIGCGSKRKIISVDGSSTVFPVTEAVAEAFQQSSRNVKVTVGISGTGGGFKKFIRGETDVQDASRPIMKEEIEQAAKNGIEYIELPICFDALTIAVNPKNDWCDHITIDELKKMWEPGAQGKVKKWSEIRAGWPDKEFKLYGAGSDSGTFDYFTEAVVGKAKASRGDYTSSEDDHTLVQGISGDPYAIGYIPFAYYEPNKDMLKAVKIQWNKNKVKEPVGPSEKTILDGTYNPMSRPLFIYVSTRAMERKPEVKTFVEFYLENVSRLAREVKYVPLPDKAYEMARKRFADRKTGSGFGGEPEIGLPIEDILKREPK